MLNMSDQQRALLMSCLPNADKYISSGNVEELLLRLDDLIIENLDEKQEFLTPQGVKLQKLYDDIYSQNNL